MCEFITLKIQLKCINKRDIQDNNQLNLKFIDCIQIDLERSKYFFTGNTDKN